MTFDEWWKRRQSHTVGPLAVDRDSAETIWDDAVAAERERALSLLAWMRPNFAIPDVPNYAEAQRWANAILDQLEKCVREVCEFRDGSVVPVAPSEVVAEFMKKKA